RGAFGVRARSPPLFQLGQTENRFPSPGNSRLDLPDSQSMSESGAQDTRSPDDSRPPGVLELRGAFGVRARSPPLFQRGQTENRFPSPGNSRLDLPGSQSMSQSAAQHTGGAVAWRRQGM